MAREFLTKTFKSGNSVALRLPKALGLVEGDEVSLVPHADGSFSFWKKDAALDRLLRLYGAFSNGFMSEGRGDIEQQEYDWTIKSHNRAA